MGKRAETQESARGGSSGKVESIAFGIYTGAAAAFAGMLAGKAVDRLWRGALRRTPPRRPESLEVPWVEAVGWSVLSGTGVAIARLLATRRASRAWHRAGGEQG